jgi:MarR family transcriptional regulator, negative regulator of the multidrug operon emrRAB
VSRTANLLGALSLMAGDRVRDATRAEPTWSAALVTLQTMTDGGSIDELRRVLGLSHSGGVRIVKRLEAEGLIAREPDPADRRAVRLHLTGAGEHEARRLLAARQAALTPLLAGLGERERAALERLLERLLASVTAGGDDANRICRLCDPGVCGHPARCPVTQAALA